MDIIYLHGLEVKTVIGVYAWERAILQPVILDVDFAADIGKVAATGDLKHGFDYDAIAKRITAFIQESQFELIENLAEAVAALLMTEFKITWLRLKVNKPHAVKNAKAVGVIIERGVKYA